VKFSFDKLSNVFRLAVRCKEIIRRLSRISATWSSADCNAKSLNEREDKVSGKLSAVTASPVHENIHGLQHVLNAFFFSAHVEKTNKMIWLFDVISYIDIDIDVKFGRQIFLVKNRTLQKI
jgi:hypothetical protein